MTGGPGISAGSRRGAVVGVEFVILAWVVMADVVLEVMVKVCRWS